jgi:hypothetical protein
MRNARTWMLALAACGVLTFVNQGSAQPAPGASQRDCQTIRTCNFGRGGSYRGCLSSYSCRVCSFVRASCYVDGTRKVCQEMKCRWG